MTSIPEDVKTELKPCPFCGSSAHIERLGDSRRSTIYQCDNCSCSLETGEEWGHARGWNRRAILTDREARSGSVPAGYKLVPVEPTPEMQNAGAVIVQSWELAGRLYSSMLAAAPSPSREETEGEKTNTEMPNSAGTQIRTTQRCGMDAGSDDRTSPVAPPSTLSPDSFALLLEAEKALEPRFEALVKAYKRGVDFACEGAGVADEDYVNLWKYVEKAAYDYADKETSAALSKIRGAE